MAMDIVTIEQPQYIHVLKNKAHEVSFPLSEEDKNLIAAMKSKLQQLGELVWLHLRLIFHDVSLPCISLRRRDYCGIILTNSIPCTL